MCYSRFRPCIYVTAGSGPLYVTAGSCPVYISAGSGPVNVSAGSRPVYISAGSGLFPRHEWPEIASAKYFYLEYLQQTTRSTTHARKY